MIPEYCDFVIADRKMWYSDCSFNSLLCQSLKNGRVEAVGFFPDERIEQKDLYRRVLLVHRELVFIPFYAENICVYHLDYKRFVNYKIPGMSKKPRYVSAIRKKDQIYIFPAYAEKAILFDVAKKKITELKEFNLQLSDLLKQNQQKFYWCGTENIGEWVYLTIAESDRIIAYHIKDKKVFFKTIGGNKKLGSIAVHENGLYISIAGQNSILYWDPINQDERWIYYKISCVHQQREYVDFPILKIFEKTIYLYFGRYKIFGKIPLFSDKVEEVNILRDDLSAYTVKQKGKNLFFYKIIEIFYIDMT